jgi:hypothetical protein
LEGQGVESFLINAKDIEANVHKQVRHILDFTASIFVSALGDLELGITLVQ